MNCKIEQLYWHQKTFNQLQTKPQFILYPHLPDLKGLCINWLEEEIFFMERKNQPSFILPVSQIKETKPLETSLSVPQLAFIIKLLVNKGIIKNQSYRNLSQIAAQSFKTNNAEKISAESLRIKSHSPDRSSVSKVKEVLITLVNHINTNFKAHVLIILLTDSFQETLQTLLEHAY